jgi:putative transcriptional regulator
LRKWLIELRNGYTQTQIAEAVGITQQMYSFIELGERRPSVEVAKKIAAVMGFHWTRFYEDDGEELTKTGTEGRG